MIRVASCAVLLFCAAPVTRAATFVVSNTASSGAGSLNGAIIAANTTPGHDTITFAIGTGTAVILGPFSSILDDVTMDGRTQPGYAGTPLIALDGGFACVDVQAASGAPTEILALVLRDCAFGVLATSPVHLRGNWIGAAAPDSNTRGVELRAGASGSIIGGTAATDRNVVSGNDEHGITLSEVTDVTISGNYIGVDPTGTAALPNIFHGIFNVNGERITIGGTSPGARNVISGNHFGMLLFGSDIIVAGNYIGTSASGTAAIPNEEGISASSSSTMIGGVDAASRNVISGNRDVGVGISATDVQILNNYIGVDATGMSPLSNGYAGVFVGQSANVDVGRSGAGNVISGTVNRVGSDGGWGVVVSIPSGPVRVRGNLIGLDASGTQPVPNLISGVLVASASTEVDVGGPSPSDGNLIANNGISGLWIESFIPMSGTTVENNTIRNNGGDGVLVFGQPNSVIRRNAISENGDLGIDVGGDGVTPNDALDVDTGPNGRQNFPQLHYATSGAGTVVGGTLESVPATTFTLEFFSSQATDPSGHGEGASFIGEMAVTTDASGGAPFTFVAPSAVAIAHVITATATGPSGTSEFSNAEAVFAQGTVQFAPAAYVINENDGTVTLTIVRTNPVGAASVNFTTVQGSATANADFTPTSGTLLFADGDSVETITITIVDDAANELAEQFSITLSSPSGASLGPLATATVTISDDDAVVAAIPTLSRLGLLMMIVSVSLLAAMAMKRAA